MRNQKDPRGKEDGWMRDCTSHPQCAPLASLPIVRSPLPQAASTPAVPTRLSPEGKVSPTPLPPPRPHCPARHCLHSKPPLGQG